MMVFRLAKVAVETVEDRSSWTADISRRKSEPA